MLTYLLKSALLLTLLYGSFALLLSRETFHRFNRLALLSVLVASLVLPAVQLTVKMPSILQSVEVPVPKISRMTMLNLVPLVVNCKLVLFVIRNMLKVQLYR